MGQAVGGREERDRGAHQEGRPRRARASTSQDTQEPKSASRLDYHPTTYVPLAPQCRPVRDHNGPLAPLCLRPSGGNARALLSIVPALHHSPLCSVSCLGTCRTRQPFTLSSTEPSHPHPGYSSVCQRHGPFPAFLFETRGLTSFPVSTLSFLSFPYFSLFSFLLLTPTIPTLFLLITTFVF